MNNPTLLGQVRRKLNVTWDDEETTARIDEIMESAVPDLKHRLGIVDSNFDFSVPGDENTLYKNYCLYEWNHVLPDFDANYANDIAQVRAKWEVKYFNESSAGGSDA